ncbi:MAG: hypothetical protein J6Q42_06470 [Clostridia bacterium]|nr:hypothetical protein [Clostridia bacterium]
MKLTAKDLAVFGMFSALMFASKRLMEALPNIHLVAMFIVVATVIYRKKALYPIYGYVFLDGLFAGFATWWIPYLYLWTVLWGAVMLLPQNLPPKIAPFVYMAVCAAHGLLFGVLYAPVQALVFGFDFRQTIAWVAAGLPFDITHAISNFCCGALIIPLITLVKRVQKG